MTCNAKLQWLIVTRLRVKCKQLRKVPRAAPPGRDTFRGRMPVGRSSAAGVGAVVADAVSAEVLQPRQVGLLVPEEVALVVGDDQSDLAARVAGLADAHAERAEVPLRVAGGVEQPDDILVALDRVVDHVVARGLCAPDGALVGVGAGVGGHVGERLGALAVVLEGRTVGGMRLVRLALRARSVHLAQRRDGAGVGDFRECLSGRHGVHDLGCRVLRAADVGVGLGSLRLVGLRQDAGDRESGAEGDDECCCDE